MVTPGRANRCPSQRYDRALTHVRSPRNRAVQRVCCSAAVQRCDRLCVVAICRFCGRQSRDQMSAHVEHVHLEPFDLRLGLSDLEARMSPDVTMPTRTPSCMTGRWRMRRALVIARQTAIFMSGLPSSPNLTPVGRLARWTQSEFNVALRTSARPDGTTMNDMMPWKSLSHLSDEALQAVLASLRTVPAAPSPGKRRQLRVASVAAPSACAGIPRAPWP